MRYDGAGRVNASLVIKYGNGRPKVMETLVCGTFVH